MAGRKRNSKGAASAAPSFISPQQQEVGPVSVDAPNVTTPAEQAPEPVKGIQMELVRNYVPVSLLRVVGWKKPALMRKNAAGQMVEVEPEEWMEGQAKPAPYPGAGFDNKLWAGTVIEVPEAEAKRMRTLRIAEAYI